MAEKLKKRTHTYPCVNLKAVTKGVIKVNQKLVGTLVMDEADEHFEFRQRGMHHVHPECHWHLLNRTKHGKASANGSHVKVEFYIRHEDYISGKQLSDMLEAEIEQLNDSTFDTAEFMGSVQEIREGVCC